MKHFLSFATSEGSILVEVDNDGDADLSGVGRTSLAQNTITTAQTAMTEGLNIVRATAEAFLKQVRQIPSVPDEVEVTFGIKATGELGAFAIAKAGGEANFTVKLKWTPERLSR